MKFEVISFSNKEKWEEIVKDKEVYYQWQYVDAFYKNNDGIPFLAYANYDDDYVFNVFLKRDIATFKVFKGKIKENTYFDITTPYGYGGIDIRGCENTNLLKFYFEEFDKYCLKNNIISEFVRLNPLNDNYRFYLKSNYEIWEFAKTIYMKLDNEEQIWNDLESSCRNKIRKALKYNLTVKSGFSKKMLDEFISIYNETMRRDKAEDYYFFKEEFFSSVFKNMKNNALIYTVYLEDKPINSVLVIYNNKNCHYHLSGSVTEYMKLSPNNLSLYEIAKDFCNKGYEKLHLGGGYGGDKSTLLTFKRSFNKDGELKFRLGKRIFDRKLYDDLVNIRLKEENFDKNSMFFPLYRSTK